MEVEEVTSQEIKDGIMEDLANREWLREIAYQLAVMNEREESVLELQGKGKHKVNLGDLGDPVRQGSDKEVRGDGTEGNAGDYAADILRSCANQIRINEMEWARVVPYLLATANEVASKTIAYADKEPSTSRPESSEAPTQIRHIWTEGTYQNQYCQVCARRRTFAEGQPCSKGEASANKELWDNDLEKPTDPYKRTTPEQATFPGGSDL